MTCRARAEYDEDHAFVWSERGGTSSRSGEEEEEARTHLWIASSQGLFKFRKLHPSLLTILSDNTFNQRR